jgi:hypothetical protein
LREIANEFQRDSIGENWRAETVREIRELLEQKTG